MPVMPHIAKNKYSRNESAFIGTEDSMRSEKYVINIRFLLTRSLDGTVGIVTGYGLDN
jgi:hypothetical protein